MCWDVKDMIPTCLCKSNRFAVRSLWDVTQTYPSNMHMNIQWMILNRKFKPKPHTVMARLTQHWKQNWKHKSTNNTVLVIIGLKRTAQAYMVTITNSFYSNMDMLWNQNRISNLFMAKKSELSFNNKIKQTARIFTYQ